MGMDMIHNSSTERNKNKKYIGSCCGNNFIILDCRCIELSNQAKARFASENIVKYGVDSALFLKKSNGLDAYMEIYEKDGSESDSCGNGAILIAYLLGMKKGRLEMKDSGAIFSNGSDRLSISMSTKFSFVKEIAGEKNCVFVKVGEPHIVYLVENIKEFDLAKIGEKIQINYPQGVNVDAVQKVNDSHYLIRTYERGILAETESCGTGSLSSYLAISHFDGKMYTEPVEFRSNGGSHWVSRDGNMLKLETLKKYCKIRSL